MKHKLIVAIVSVTILVGLIGMNDWAVRGFARASWTTPAGYGYGYGSK